MAICGLLLPALAATAQVDHSGHTDKTHTLSGVVVTGQYKVQDADSAVQRVRVVDSKKIAAMGAQNIRDVLLNEMNVTIAQDNALGSSIQIQGVSGQNVKILIDGVPVIGRQAGNIDVSQLNIYNVERIELIEGPMSVNYGTDALAGTINIITKSKLNHKWEGGVNTYYETIGKYNINANAGYHKGAHTLLAGGARNFFDGWNKGEKIRFFDFSDRPADSSRAQQWDPKEEYNANLQYSYRKDNINLRFKSEYFYDRITNRDLPLINILQRINTGAEDVYNTYRINNAIFADGKLSRNLRFTFLAAYNHYKRLKNTFIWDLDTMKRGMGRNEDQDTTFNKLFNSRGTIVGEISGGKLGYELGYDVNIETGTGRRVLNKEQQISDYAVYGSAEYKLYRNLVIRPGLRYAYNTAYDAPLVPSMNIRYQLGKKLVWRAAYARGFRAPDVKELYFEFKDSNHDIFGNPDLKAEYSNNYNTAFTYNNQYRKLTYKLEVSGFYNNITNMISLVQPDLAVLRFTYRNIDRYKTHGVQLNLNGSYRNLSIGLGGSYIGRYNQLSETERSPATAFSYSPEFRTNIGYEWKKQGLTASLFLKYTGEMPGYGLDSAGNIVLNTISSYAVADFSLSKNIKNKLAITAGIKNLFDVSNVNRSSMATAPNSGGGHTSFASGSWSVSTGRSYFIGVGYKFVQ